MENILRIITGFIVIVFLLSVFVILSPIFLIGALLGSEKFIEIFSECPRVALENQEECDKRKVNECPLKEQHK